MNITDQYRTTVNNSDFNIREYVTPALHFDPRKEILERKNADYKNKPRQKKFKATHKHKPCYLDEQIEPFVKNPSPDKYKKAEGFGPDAPGMKRHKSADLKKIDLNAKKGTYIDNIEKYEQKHKPPGVGKFDITKDPWKKKFINIKQKELPEKKSNMDDIKYLGAGVPGAGFYNPHSSVPHLTPNRTDYKFFKTKHAEEETKKKKALSTKLGPTTYNPVTANTFDSISRDKNKFRSHWEGSAIDLRKGLRSHYKSPSPAEYKLTNQWSARDPREKVSEIGQVKIFERTSKSFKTLSVYH